LHMTRKDTKAIERPLRETYQHPPLNLNVITDSPTRKEILNSFVQLFMLRGSRKIMTNPGNVGQVPNTQARAARQ
jgi:hypothetical protein